jgi:biotin transport system substrate-specific component
MDLKWSSMISAFIGGIVVMYIPGIIGMAVVLDKNLAVATGFALPFIPGDLLKVVLCGLLTAGLARARPAAILWRG